MNQFYDDHPIIANIGIILFCFITFLGFNFFSKVSIIPPGVSVSRVLSDPGYYDGKEVIIRGYSQGPIFVSTLILCEPPTCDCNSTYARHLILTNEKDYEDIETQSILVEALECKGDECKLVCAGFTPNDGLQYAFHGVMKDDGYQITLIDVNLDKSKRKTGILWIPVMQQGGEIDH
ncbi:MAG: hypothetical protein GQ555_07205 [Desulfobacterales bacterium]|nr:hypothetical protein [Desulfobacterales bacterium]